MKKLDLYREHRDQYVTPRDPVLLKIPPARYLTIDGEGEPGGDAFAASVGALYKAAYTLKMAGKRAGRDYAVCKLEGLWWAGDGTDFREVPRSKWRWKLMIRTPEFVTAKSLEALKIAGVRLETLREGACVQVLHVGSYDEEPRTVARMKEFAIGRQLSLKGPHHEIYLSDPRRVPPARLRTILRHPVRKD